MSEQRQHGSQQKGFMSGSGPADEADSAERLAAARDSLDRIFAAAAPILEEIQRSNSEQRLRQMRQTGGE